MGKSFIFLVFFCAFIGSVFAQPSFKLASPISVLPSTTFPLNSCITVTATVQNLSTAGTFDFECDLDNISGSYSIVVQKQCGISVGLSGTHSLTFNSNFHLPAGGNLAGSYKINIKVSLSSCTGCGTNPSCLHQVTAGIYTIPLPVTISNSTCSGYCMDNTPVTTNSGTFFDAGGGSNDYGDNEFLTKTFSPATAGNKLSVSFSSFAVESCCDYLRVYDGPNTSSPLHGTYTGTSLPPSFTATNSGGQLTFYFYSDYANPCPTSFSGWQATISSITSCSAIAPSFCTTSIGSPANGLQHHINLSCSSVAGVDGYSFDYSNDGVTWYNFYTGPSSSLDVNNSDNPNKAYYFRVRTYCGSVYSGYTNAFPSPIYTACDDAATPTLSAATSNSVKVTLNSEFPMANPSITTYAIYCSTTGQYVQSGGSLGFSPYYQTKASWGTVTVTGLSSSTSYCFYAQARNALGDIRYNSSNSSCLSTLSGVVASFYTIPGAPLYTGSSIEFMNTSTGIPAPYIFTWDFGDGYTSALTNPYHTYSTCGWKTVYMTANNGLTTGSVTQTIYVNSTSSPVVSLSADNYNANAGNPINFNGSGTNCPASFMWYIYGGTPAPAPLFSSGSSPGPYSLSATFNVPGFYTATLGVTNSLGSGNGTIHFTVHPTSTYQCLPPYNYVIQQGYNSAHAVEPVDLATGSYEYKHTDFNIPAVGASLDFTRYYSTVNNTVNSALGFGWSHTYDFYITNQADTTWLVHYGDGHTSTFIPLISGGGTSFALYGGTYETLYKDPGTGNFKLTFKNGDVYYFNSSLKLANITDLNGNTTTLNYAGANLTSIVATGGRTLNFAYSGANIATVTDPLSRTIHYNYTGGDLTSVTDANGGVTGFSYTGTNLIHQITNARGSIILTNAYDIQNRVTSQSDALLNTTNIVYTSMAPGDATVTYPGGVTSSVHHDAYFRLTQATDELGHTKYYSYDYNNNTTSITDENGNIINFTSDTLGNQLAINKPLSANTSVIYNPFSKPASITDPLAHTLGIDYDTHANILAIHLPDGSSKNYSYYPNGKLHTSTDALGHVTTFNYSPSGDLTSAVSPAGTKTFTCDLSGRRTAITDENGHTTNYQYNNNDMVIKITNALSATIIDSFDSDNELIYAKDNNGNQSRFKYDVKDRLDSVVDARGGVKTFNYDSRDNLITITDANGHATSYGYDAKKQLTSKTTSLGTTHYGYDPAGNKVTETDAMGNTKHYTCDALNRRTSSQDALGNTTGFAYNPLSQLTGVTDAMGRTTSYNYNTVGLLTVITDGAGVTTTAGYDANGNRTSLTDPNGHAQSFGYDASGRLNSYTDAAGSVYGFTYDGVGNLTNETKPGGGTIARTYNAINLATNVTNSTGDNYTYTYDANGNVLTSANTTGTSHFAYDSLSHLKQYTDMFGKIVQYSYDAAGNKTKIIYPGGNVVNYSFNNDNMLDTVTDWLGHHTTYNYDPDGRLTEQDYSVAGVNCTYIYNPAGQLTTQTNNYGTSVISKSIFTFDPTGNRTQEQKSGPMPFHLTADSFAYSYGPDDRLTSNGVTSFTNNLSGSRTAQGATSYGFSVDNLLNNITTPSVTTTFHYDAKGNRIEKIQSGIDRKYVLDLSTNLSQVLQETDAGGTVKATYIYGLGLIARVDSAGHFLYYHFDPQHNTVALSNDTGVTDTYTYDPFGAVLKHKGITQQPFTFLGQYGVMQETSTLYYVRARYFDAANGRFLSKDNYPSSLSDPQTLNRYVYGLNDPVNKYDVNGNNIFGDAWNSYVNFADNFSNKLGNFAGKVDIIALQTAAAAGDFSISYLTVRALPNPIGLAIAGQSVNEGTKNLKAAWANIKMFNSPNFYRDWKKSGDFSGLGINDKISLDYFYNDPVVKAAVGIASLITGGLGMLEDINNYNVATEFSSLFPDYEDIQLESLLNIFKGELDLRPHEFTETSNNIIDVISLFNKTSKGAGYK